MIEIDIENFFIICAGFMVFGFGILLTVLAYCAIDNHIEVKKLVRNPSKDRI